MNCEVPQTLRGESCCGPCVHEAWGWMWEREARCRPIGAPGIREAACSEGRAWGAISSSIAPREDVVDGVFPAGHVLLFYLLNIHFLFIENNLNLSPKFFLMFVLSVPVSESTNSSMILEGIQTVVYQEGKKLWWDLQGCSSCFIWE